MFVDEIRRQAEVSARAALPAIAQMMWKAFGAGQVTEAEATDIEALIQARMIVQAVPAQPAKRVGSRPRTDASMERRRRWAASGWLPPALAARFTLAEQSVLSLVANEIVRRKDCRLPVGGMAAIAGVSETTVRNAIREAGKLGMLTVEERRLTGWRNDTNIVRIVSVEWTAWLRLNRKRKLEGGNAKDALPEGGGCKSAKGTTTRILDLGIPRITEPSRGLPKGSGRPQPRRSKQNRGGR